MGLQTNEEREGVKGCWQAYKNDPRWIQGGGGIHDQCCPPTREGLCPQKPITSGSMGAVGG